MFVSGTLPETTVGYGHDYEVALENGQPAPRGILVARSHFEGAPDMIRWFDIQKGKVTLPKEGEIRFAFYTLHGFPVFIGRFMNAESTYLYPLVRGYLPGEVYYRGDGGANVVAEAKPAPKGFVLQPCDVATERRNLHSIDSDMEGCPEDQKESDRRARGKIREYVRSPIEELGQ